MLKQIGFILGMIAIALLVFFLAIPAEDQFLDSLVTTGPDITLDAWRDSFRYWAALGIAIALSVALFWFVLGQWVFSMNRWSGANNKRTVWFGLMVVTILAAIPGVILTPPVQEGGRMAWLLYLANNLTVFYLATLLLSPSSFKYTPWGASLLRRW